MGWIPYEGLGGWGVFVNHERRARERERDRERAMNAGLDGFGIFVKESRRDDEEEEEYQDESYCIVFLLLCVCLLYRFLMALQLFHLASSPY